MKKIYRFGIGLLLCGTGLYLLALFLLYFFQEKLLFHPQVLEQEYKFTFSDAFEEVYIPVSDDVKLHGILFRAKDSKGLVFYLHGNGGCVEDWGDAAANFTSAGYDLFMLDYRGYGKSGGTIESEAQINEDIEKAFAYMEKDYQLRNIIIAGYSIGTGPATHLAAKKKVKALILQAPYYSLTGLSGEKVPLIPEFVKRYKFNTGSEILKVNAPVYIFHGTEDKLIPYEHSLKLKKKAGDRAVLIPLPGEGHNAINDSALFKEKLSGILKKI
ncbi:alpha/beta hydrolase [Flavobacterium album]|uniref:Alpha/beta hydrolase n=1 Tax=Flavobacterium album TaxID=2175091 RepID=A0A2S1QY21_9FLAO|nr:alpha/beta fold hydrolase [Flavobacterium album]AWH85274.1 alpha/beta hydrolase [Flavobacterium album]